MDFWGIRDISTWKGFFLYTCMELLIFLLSSLSIVNIDSQHRYVGSFCTDDSQMIKETKNWMLFFPLLVMILFTFSDVNVFDIPLFLFLITIASLWSRDFSDVSAFSLHRRRGLLCFIAVVYCIKWGYGLPVIVGPSGSRPGRGSGDCCLHKCPTTCSGRF